METCKCTLLGKDTFTSGNGCQNLGWYLTLMPQEGMLEVIVMLKVLVGRNQVWACAATTYLVGMWLGKCLGMLAALVATESHLDSSVVLTSAVVPIADLVYAYHVAIGSLRGSHQHLAKNILNAPSD